jgi:NADPH:quinone reductase-like Zn-dependent oxidoreductase
MSFETETVMTQRASPNARSFSSAITSIVAKSGNPTMKAIYLEERGGSGALVAGEIPRPKPQAGEVLVKVRATTVMPSELQWFTTFHLPFGEPRAFPIVLSHERTTLFEEVVKEVDVVFDAVGGETLERSWPLVANGGRVVTVATQSKGASAQRASDAFMMVRPEGSQLAQIARVIDAGELRSCVGTIFPLAAARLAYARAAHGFRRGKIVLRVTESYAPQDARSITHN